MKQVIIALFLFSNLAAAQADSIYFSPKEIKSLEKLNLTSNDSKNYKLKKILNVNKRRKTGKTVAIIGSTLALGILTHAATTSQDGFYKSVLLAFAIRPAVISIPFGLASRKRTKELNKLLEEY